jgi:hypothetical protein
MRGVFLGEGVGRAKWSLAVWRYLAVLILGIAFSGLSQLAFPAKSVSRYWAPGHSDHIYGQPQLPIPMAAMELYHAWYAAATGNPLPAGYPPREQV